MSADPAPYRSKDEVDEWARRDPIALHEARLAAEGILDAQGAARLKQEVETEVAQAMAQAREDPMPGPEVLGIDRVFAGA